MILGKLVSMEGVNDGVKRGGKGRERRHGTREGKRSKDTKMEEKKTERMNKS